MDTNSTKATRKAGVNALSPPQSSNAVVLPPDVGTLIDQFRGFQRKSAEGYIGLGHTVWTASETLSREKLRQFCAEVALEFEGAHYKALLRVGENAPRFQAVMDKVPDKPTTIDWMARIPADQFDRLLPHIKPDSKKRELLELLPTDPSKKRTRRKKAAAVAKGWMIAASGLDERATSEVHDELKKLSERFGFSLQAVDPAAQVAS